MNELAIDGGKPVRERPFPTSYRGVSLYGEEEIRQLTDVVNSKTPFRHYGINAPCKVDQFEKRLADYVGTKYALGTSTGTAALFVAVAALGIGPGDEVIIPALAYDYPYCAVAGLGALPVFADIDESLNIDPVSFEKRITDKTKAVVVIHFWGGCGKLDEIMRIAKARNVKVIEDIAESLGVEYNGAILGAVGDISMVTFQASKMIGCGEGGAILTDNADYYRRAVLYHDLGRMRASHAAQLGLSPDYYAEYSFAGVQCRMSEFHGAVMLAQMGKLDGILSRLRKNHKILRDAFAENTFFSVRFHEGDAGNCVLMLFKKANETENFQNALAAEGIPVSNLTSYKNPAGRYPVKSHKLPHENLPPFGKGFNGENYNYAERNDCRQTDEILGRSLYIPNSIHYTEDDLNDIKNAVMKVEKNLKRS